MIKFYIIILLFLLSCTNNKSIKEEKIIIKQEKIYEIFDFPTEDKCPPDMIYVNGKYCPILLHKCLDYIDPPNSIIRRCLKFAEESKCFDNEVKMSFCIDKEEWYDLENLMPIVDVNWFEAKKMCENMDKRLCSNEEWVLSCEGNERFPYPYGYNRSKELCNIDKKYLINKKWKKLIDQREPINDRPGCLSPFGVHNMTGNVDEWVYLKKKQPFKSGLKGGYWGPVRNKCRATTTAHNEWHKQEQIGFRCCRNSINLN